MNTQVEEVFDAFLQKITDYSFANNLSDEELEEKLHGLLKTAIRQFRKCRKSLKLKKDPITSEIDFAEELDGMEIEILSYLMIVEHLNAKVVSSEGLEQVLTDKDFKVYSQANQLQNVEQIRKNFRALSNKMITEYLYEGYVRQDD